MKVKVKRIAKNTIPLCYIDDGNLLCYKCGSFIIYKGNNIILQHKPVFKGFKDIFLSRIKIIVRFFRLGVRVAIHLDKKTVIISKSKSIYEYDFINNKISSGFSFKERIRPLNFSKIENIKGFDNSIVFGGYLSNPNRKNVSIYKRVGVDKWDVIFTFKEGLINHIHNIVGDPYRNCVWIFTGDFEHSAAIWKATDNFKTVECFFSGDQRYRACQAFVTPDGLLYATDTPFMGNYIFFLKFQGNKSTLQKIASISGSCIYATTWKSNYVFSTTVESNGFYSNFLSFLIDKKRGDGIIDNKSHMYIGDIESGFKDVLSYEKDKYPFSFQFGVFRFPDGHCSDDNLCFYPVGTKIYDLDLISLNKEINDL